MNIINVLLTNILSNKYIKYGGLLLLSILAYWYYQYQLNVKYQEGYDKATEVVTNEYEKRELALQHRLDTLTIQHQQEVNTLRQSLEAKQQEYINEYERGKQDAQETADRVITELRRTNQRLSIETRSTRKAHTPTGATCPARTTSDTVERTALSERSARFLIGQATDADNTVRLLNLCKQTLWETRRTVDEYNKTLNKQ